MRQSLHDRSSNFVVLRSQRLMCTRQTDISHIQLAAQVKTCLTNPEQIQKQNWADRSWQLVKRQDVQCRSWRQPQLCDILSQAWVPGWEVRKRARCDDLQSKEGFRPGTRELWGLTWMLDIFATCYVFLASYEVVGRSAGVGGWGGCRNERPGAVSEV